MEGAESEATGSIIASVSGLIGVVLAKCRCVYKRDSQGDCSPSCGFSDKPLTTDDHQIDIYHETIDDVPVLIVTKTI